MYMHVWSGVVMYGVVWMGRSTYAYVPFFRSRMYIYIPADMELTAEEKQRREVKRKILEMAREKERAEAMGGEHQGYRMPEVSWLGAGLVLDGCRGELIGFSCKGGWGLCVGESDRPVCVAALG